MYIYDRKLLVSRSPGKERPVTPQPAQRNSYHSDRVISGSLGGGGSSSPYVWANEGLGQLVRPHLTFDVGHIIPARRYVRMPITFEELTADGTGGQIILQLRCDTLAEVEVQVGADASATRVPLSAPADPIQRFIFLTDLIGSATSTNALWRTDAAGRLEAALDLVVFYPAASAGASELATGGPFPLAVICMGNYKPFLSHNITAERLDTIDSSGRHVRQVTSLTFGAETTSHLGFSAVSLARPPEVGGAGTIEYLQEDLARHGIISVSVSTNGAALLQLMIETRADYVLKALAEIGRFASDSASRFFRKVNFGKVAYIGHSRGGDAVLRAVHKNRSAKVRALVQLAPSDLSGLTNGRRPSGRISPKTSFVTTPMRITEDLHLKYLCIYGSRDGDVSGWRDQRTQVIGTGFRHYDRASAQRAFQFWHGATHSRFSRLWKGSDEPIAPIPPGLPGSASFLDRPTQERRTTEAVGGWLRFVLNDETSEADRFNGRRRTAMAPTLPVVSMWKFGKNLKTIDRFDDDRRSDRNTLGGRNIAPSSGLVDEVRLANENPPGAGESNFQFMHIDQVLRASLPSVGAPPSRTSSSGGWRAEIPTAHQDFSRFTLLTLRVTKRFEESEVTAASTDAAKVALLPTITITLRDRKRGRASAAAASSARVPSLPDVRKVLLPHVGLQDLTKYHFETCEVDLSRFAGVNRHQVASVEVEMAGLVGQSIYVDTLSLVKL